jgi:hypothetical protein
MPYGICWTVRLFMGIPSLMQVFGIRCIGLAWVFSAFAVFLGYFPRQKSWQAFSTIFIYFIGFCPSVEQHLKIYKGISAPDRKSRHSWQLQLHSNSQICTLSDSLRRLTSILVPGAGRGGCRLENLGSDSILDVGQTSQVKIRIST